MREGVDGFFDIDTFKEKVYKEINYARNNLKVTYPEMIGMLEIIQLSLVNEMVRENPEGYK